VAEPEDAKTPRQDAHALNRRRGPAAFPLAPNDLRDALVAHAHDLGDSRHRQAIAVRRPNGLVALGAELLRLLVKRFLALGVGHSERDETRTSFRCLTFRAGDAKIVRPIPASELAGITARPASRAGPSRNQETDSLVSTGPARSTAIFRRPLTVLGLIAALSAGCAVALVAPGQSSADNQANIGLYVPYARDIQNDDALQVTNHEAGCLTADFTSIYDNGAGYVVQDQEVSGDVPAGATVSLSVHYFSEGETSKVRVYHCGDATTPIDTIDFVFNQGYSYTAAQPPATTTPSSSTPTLAAPTTATTPAQPAPAPVTTTPSATPPPAASKKVRVCSFGILGTDATVAQANALLKLNKSCKIGKVIAAAGYPHVGKAQKAQHKAWLVKRFAVKTSVLKHSSLGEGKLKKLPGGYTAIPGGTLMPGGTTVHAYAQLLHR
jgi:hypothetical protein